MSVWDEGPLLSPSLICFDLCNLESQVRVLEAAGARLLHVDILDGYFSPSMPLGLDTVRQLRAKTSLPFDVHLMAERPDFFVEALLDIGVEQLVFHLEAAPHVDALLNRVRAAGVRAGVALKPATPLTQLEYVLEKCDTVLVMLINPGYASSGAERQVPYARRKLDALREMIETRGLPVKIEVDGRISPENLRGWGGGLVDIFVAGSTCIDRADIAGSMAGLRALQGGVVK